MKYLLPESIVRRLPKKSARRVIRSRIAKGKLRDLSRYFPEAGDPIFGGAVWECLDYLADVDAFDRIEELSDQVGGLDDFERFLLNYLETAGSERTHSFSAATQTDTRFMQFDSFDRMCLRSWALYISLTHYSDAKTGQLGFQDAEIVQFWAQRDIPADVSGNLNSWERMFPSRWCLFDDQSAYLFLAKEWGQTEAELFRSASHPAIRSDYFRLGYLAKRGGIYVDADTLPRRQTKTILDNLPEGGALCFETSQARSHIVNGFMAAASNDAFLIAAFTEAGRRLRLRNFPVQALAGGYLLSDVATAPEGPPVAHFTSVSTWFLRHRILRPGGAKYKDTSLNWRLHDRN